MLKCQKCGRTLIFKDGNLNRARILICPDCKTKNIAKKKKNGKVEVFTTA